jgi:hypothetical protein
MTARTTPPRSSKGSLGKRGRRLQERLGRSAACGYHAPGRSAGMAARLMVTSWGGGEGGRPTCQLPATCGLVKEPVAAHAVGNAVADMRSLPAGLGKTQRPVDRGAGGDRCQSDIPCGTRRLPPTRPQMLSIPTRMSAGFPQSGRAPLSQLLSTLGIMGCREVSFGEPG